MNRIGPLVPVGKIVKPHGVDGGMKVALKDTFEGLDLSEQFVFVNFEGLPVPFGRWLLIPKVSIRFLWSV